MPKDTKGKGKASLPPGSNWMALKSTLPKSETIPSKRRRINPAPMNSNDASSSQPESHTPQPFVQPARSHLQRGSDTDVAYLRSMILGHTLPEPSSSTSSHILSSSKIGKYVALDCEMVGVGPPTTDERTGKTITESSLARVSLVNYHGETVLDAFVKQKERVTDYRTHVSGVRPEDLVGKDALSFEDVQRKVADAIKGRILVGHAVFNDLKALLLKHSSLETKDTQKNAAIRAAYKTSRPGLRTVIQKEFDLDIQSGEHSSVIDARATMALYRLYKNRSAKPSKQAVEDSQASSEGFARNEASAFKSQTPRSTEMPFKESRNQQQHSDLDNDDDHSDWEDDEDENKSSSTRMFEVPVNSSKKRKRSTKDDDNDLLLHVVSEASNPVPTPTPALAPTPSASAIEPKSKSRQKSKAGTNTNLAFPGGGRKGISSGLSTVVRTHGKSSRMGDKRALIRGGGGGRGSNPATEGDWWSKL